MNVEDEADDVIPDMQCKVDVFGLLQAGLGATPDDLSFRWI
jgi:hypothetical protein